MRTVFLRIAHLPLLALWAVALTWLGRAVASERHFQTSLKLNDTPNAQIAELGRALQLLPSHGFAWASLGRIYLAVEQWKPAIASSRKALRFRFNLNLAKQLGSAYFRCGDLASACREFQEILRFLPNDEESLYRLAYLLVRSDHPKEAEQAALQYRDYYSRAPEVDWILGKAAEMQGRPRRAMHCFHRFCMRGKATLLPKEIYADVDWVRWLRQWDRFIGEVEKGRIVPSEAQKVD